MKIGTAAFLCFCSGCDGKKKTSSNPENLPKGDLVERVELATTSPAPDANTAPYRNCLITAKFELIDVLSGKIPDGPILASFRAFKERIPAGSEKLRFLPPPRRAPASPAKAP